MSSNSSPAPSKASELTDADLELQDIPNLLQLIGGKCRSIQSNYVTIEMLESAKSDMQKSFLKKLSLHNSRLKEVEEKCEELKLKVGNFENEMKVCGDTTATLKSDLATFTDKFENVSGELQERNQRFEDRSTGLLRTLSDDIQIEVAKWNVKQSLLEEELGKIKKGLEKLGPPQTIPQVINGNNEIKVEKATETTPSPTGNVSSKVILPTSGHQPSLRQTPPPPSIMVTSSEEGAQITTDEPTTSANSPESLIDELIGIPVVPVGSTILANGSKPSTSSKPIPKGLDHGVNPLNPSGRGCRCGKQYPTESSLNKHIRYFTTDRKFACKYCPKQFRRKALLINHISRLHQTLADTCSHPTPTTSESSGPKGTLKVTVPKRRPLITGTSKAGKRLIAHGKAPKTKGEGDLPISCFCGMQFYTIIKFSQHLDIHGRFSCKQCPKGFSNRKDLDVHIKMAHLTSPSSLQSHGKVSKPDGNGNPKVYLDLIEKGASPGNLARTTTSPTPTHTHPVQSTSTGNQNVQESPQHSSPNLSFLRDLEVKLIQPKKLARAHASRVPSLNKLWGKRSAQFSNNANRIQSQPSSSSSPSSTSSGLSMNIVKNVQNQNGQITQDNVKASR